MIRNGHKMAISYCFFFEYSDYTLGDTGFVRLQGIKVLWRLQLLEYFRTLKLKFQKARTKIDVGRLRTTSTLVRAFWNFKLEVLKYPRNCSLQSTLIPNLVKPLLYLLWWCCAWSWWLMHCYYFRNQVIFILIFMILIISVRWFFTVGMGRPEIWVTIVVIWIWPIKKHKKNVRMGLTRDCIRKGNTISN